MTSPFATDPVNPVPNEAQGDVKIKLGSHNLVMRPTPRATAEIESQTGRGTMALINALVERELTVKEMGIIVAAGIRAHGSPDDRRANAAKCEQLIWETGMMHVVGPVQTFMLRSVNGGRDELPFDSPEAGEASLWTTGPSENGAPSPSLTSDGAPENSGTEPGTTSTPPSVTLVNDPNETGGVPIPARAHKRA